MTDIKMKERIRLGDFTTFKIGGEARYFVSVSTIDEMRESLSFAKEKKLPFFVFGGGSNLLVSDNVINAVVIQNKIKGISFKDDGATVLACACSGENWDDFVSRAVEENLWGVENLSGIPGTVGASPVQNIGAYGVEVKDTIEYVEALDSHSLSEKIFTNKECGFGYRDSFFKSEKGKRFIIIKVAFRLQTDGAPNISYKDLKNYFIGKKEPSLREIRNAVLEIRTAKFPDSDKSGTAGSFFKNPIISKNKFEELKKKFPDISGFEVADEEGKVSVKLSLAFIIDKICGLKGFKKGNSALWENQSLVIVNEGGASARAISEFADEIEEKVKQMTGIKIEREVQSVNI